ncbi:MAG TPA: hypothetical protein VIU11_26475 [Nakamurella sp.]
MRTKGRILDEVVSVTGWSRDNARRRLAGAAQSPPGAGRQVAAPPPQAVGDQSGLVPGSVELGRHR